MNTIGTQFKVTSFGESHGTLVGCVIDGCPAGLKIDTDLIQFQVNRRKTNQSSFSTSRMEDDIVEIVSGVFEGKTLGSPITLLIKNHDAKSTDYDSIKDIYRPNHADYTNELKYGFRDHRGGGRSSIRVTAPLVAAGEIANQLLKSCTQMQVKAYVSKIGHVELEEKHQYSRYLNYDIDSNSVRCPDESKSKEMLALIEEQQLEGDTLGGVITCVIQHVEPGLGEPIFGKLQAELGHAMLSINTVKGFEYGYGFDSSSMKGSEYNDSFLVKENKVKTSTNFSGGIQGGISNGMDIYFRVGFKPISSIHQSQKSIDKEGNSRIFEIGGRHDVCAVPRAVPIVEAYTSIILADNLLKSKHSKL